MIQKFTEFTNENYKTHSHISDNSNPNNKSERKVSFTRKAFKEFNEWKVENKEVHNKLIKLIEDMLRNPDLYKPQSTGLGKSERLKGLNASSKKITAEHRLVYRVFDQEIEIISCRSHYEGLN